MWSWITIYDLGLDRQTLPKQVSIYEVLILSSKWFLLSFFSAKGVELRFGLTHRDYPEQKSVGKALAVHTTVDVGLILLKDTLKITSLVKPALLPRISQVSDMFVDKTATLAGLGVENQKTYAVSTYVKYASFRIMSNDECGKVFGPQPVTIICAKSDTSLASSCPGKILLFPLRYWLFSTKFIGDSGSPLVIYEGTNTIVVGVVGFGAGAGCDLGGCFELLSTNKLLIFELF